MSDPLTHSAMFWDVRRLARLDEEVQPRFRELLDREWRYGWLGTNTHRGAKIFPALIERDRESRDGRGSVEADRKTAFALGGVVHAACDHVMKQLLTRSTLRDETSASPLPDAQSWIYAYHDAHVFRHVFRDGKEGPFNAFTLADNTTGPGKALEAFVRAAFLAGMLLQHGVEKTPRGERGENGKLLSDEKGRPVVSGTTDERPEPEVWADNVLFAYRELYVDVSRLVEAYNRPDSVLLERYGIETEFYREDDPAIRAARALQRGEALSTAEIREALRPGANESHYGWGLQLAVEYLRSASAFWRGEAEDVHAPNYKMDWFKHRPREVLR